MRAREFVRSLTPTAVQYSSDDERSDLVPPDSSVHPYPSSTAARGVRRPLAPDSRRQFDPLRLTGVWRGRDRPHFRSHACPLVEDAAVSALDGKTLRCSLDRFKDRKTGQVLIEDAGKDH